MASFNATAFISGAVNQLLKEDPGGFKNFDEMLIKLRKTLATARRRAVSQDLSSIGQGGVQTVAQLFAPGTREIQAGESEVDAVNQLNAQNEQMKAARRAEAERLATQQLPVAYAEFQRKNQPSGLSKIAGAVLGGAASTFLPMAGGALAAKLFPNLFPASSPAPTPIPQAAPPDTAFASISETGGEPANLLNPYQPINWAEFLQKGQF